VESFKIGCLESFKPVWKVSKPSGKFQNCLESFPSVWKGSRLSGKFPESLESFQNQFWNLVHVNYTRSRLCLCKVSRISGKFPDCLESFQYLCINCKSCPEIWVHRTFWDYRRKKLPTLWLFCHNLQIVRKHVVFSLFSLFTLPFWGSTPPPLLEEVHI